MLEGLIQFEGMAFSALEIMQIFSFILSFNGAKCPRDSWGWDVVSVFKQFSLFPEVILSSQKTIYMQRLFVFFKKTHEKRDYGKHFKSWAIG